MSCTSLSLLSPLYETIAFSFFKNQDFEIIVKKRKLQPNKRITSPMTCIKSKLRRWLRYTFMMLWARLWKLPLVEKELSLLTWVLYGFMFLSFQNYHELQPEGDPASSIRSEPTPTLHVSKYSMTKYLWQPCFSCLQKSHYDVQCLTVCSVWL